MTTRAERIVKLSRIAQQTASPNEAAVARQKLQAKGEWPPKVTTRYVVFNPPPSGPMRRTAHADPGPFAGGDRSAPGAFMDEMIEHLARSMAANSTNRDPRVVFADEEQRKRDREAFHREWLRAQSVARRRA